MDVMTLFNHLEKYGNTICKASEVNNKNSIIYAFIEKYNVQKVKIIKKGGSKENNVIVLSVDKALMTSDVKNDILQMIMERDGDLCN